MKNGIKQVEEQNKFPPLNSDKADVASISPLSRELISKDDGKGNNATRKKNGVRIRSNQVQVYLLLLLLLLLLLFHNYKRITLSRK